MLPKSSLYRSITAILKKDFLNELRSYYALSTLIMFILTALSSLSMSLGGITPAPHLLAALLWVILFFSAMAGLSRVFAQEADAGTLFTLKVYALPQAVYFGKLIFSFLLLAGINIILLPLFILFFNIDSPRFLPLLGILLLGSAGLAAVSTLTAAMSAQARGRSSLFTVLTFPLILPQFLSAIRLTGTILSAKPPTTGETLFLAGYAVAAITAGSLLFDFLWSD
ncbi:MAG: heme exporter protein CcmB [Clostridiales bacterium]|nr:heme exporter protein CcmB [Clostridiales bacterium]